MGARAARYLNPGTRRLLEDPQLAGPERSPNGAAEASDLCPVRVLPWAGLPLLPVRFLMALLRRPTVSGPATLRTGLGPAALPAPPPFASLFPRLRTSSQPAPLSSSCGRPGPWGLAGPEAYPRRLTSPCLASALRVLAPGLAVPSAGRGE